MASALTDFRQIPMRTPSDPNYRRVLGQRVKSLRKARNATQKDIAGLLGISYQQLNKYEGGQNLPPADMLAKLARTLDVSVDFLVTGQQPKGQTLANTRLLDRFKVLETFPPSDIETIITVIDAMVARRLVAGAVNPFDQKQTA